MRYASVTDRLAGLGSDKWAVHFRARQMKQAGHEIIELTIGEPDIPTPTDMIDVAERAMRAGRTGYSSGRGEPALLAALSAKYTARTGRQIGPENIMCFSGTQTALSMVMMGLAEEGDEIITGDPLYATYDGVVRATGATRVSVPLRPEKGFRMQAADLERVITPRSRVLLLNSPHNPTGAVLSAAEIAEIGEVCIRHNLWIVSDEVYELMIYNGTFASPLDRAELADRTIAVASISKSHAAPGFRSGWCIAPKEFTERLLPLSESMLFGGQPFIADMTAYALEPPIHRGCHDARELSAPRPAHFGTSGWQGGHRCQNPASGHVHSCRYSRHRAVRPGIRHAPSRRGARRGHAGRVLWRQPCRLSSLEPQHCR